MTGTLIKRGPETWWWRWQVNGRRYSRTFRAPDRKSAAKHVRNVLVAEVEQEAERGGLGERAGFTMANLLDEFERDYLPGTSRGTQRGAKSALALWRRFFVTARGDPLVIAVRRSDIAAYLDWRRQQRGGGGEGPVSQRTLRKDYAGLHKLFAWAVEHREYRADNPVVRQLKPARGDERQAIILSEADVERLLTACGKRPMLRLFILLCAETGVRPNSEALWLRWEDVDFRRHTLKVVSGRDGHRTKTGKSRTLPLSEPLAVALREHFATYRLGGASPWVFHHLTTRRRAKAGERLGGLLHAFQNAVKRAKLPASLRPYDLRHTRITRWVAAGHNLALVQKAAGHSSVRTTMGYVHLTDDDLSVLVRRRPAAIDVVAQLATG